MMTSDNGVMNQLQPSIGRQDTGTTVTSLYGMLSGQSGSNDMNSSGCKPRITETQLLREIVERLKREGFPTEEIPRHIVSVALVDLDDLNAVMKAA